MTKLDYKEEALLIGDYKIYQSPHLYRFTSDAVILSRFAPEGQKAVIDLCSGSGIVGLHYFALNDESVERVTLCEIQKDLAEMSEASVKLNRLEDKFVVLDKPLQELEERECYDLVLCNPPYKKRGSGFPVKNEHLAICRSEVAVTLGEIVSMASKLLKRKGVLCMCNAVDRLEETFAAFSAHGLSASRLCFVSAKENENPYLFLIEGVKGIKKTLTVENQKVNSSKDFSGV